MYHLIEFMKLGQIYEHFQLLINICRDLIKIINSALRDGPPEINYGLLCVATALPGSIMYCFVLRPVPVPVPGGSADLRDRTRLPERSRKSAGPAHLRGINYVFFCVATAPPGSILYCLVLLHRDQLCIALCCDSYPYPYNLPP